jgi:hypothetical protein
MPALSAGQRKDLINLLQLNFSQQLNNFSLIFHEIKHVIPMSTIPVMYWCIHK